MITSAFYNDCYVPGGINESQPTIIEGEGANITVLRATDNYYPIELWDAVQQYIVFRDFIVDCVNCVEVSSIVKIYDSQGVLFERMTWRNMQSRWCSAQSGSGCKAFINDSPSQRVIVRDVLVENIGVQQTALDGRHWGVAFYVMGSDNLFERITLRNILGECLQFWNQVGPTSHRNIIRNSFCEARGFLVSQGSGNQIYNNIVYSPDGTDDTGLYLFAGCDDCLIASNTVVGFGWGVLGWDSTSNGVIRKKTP